MDRSLLAAPLLAAALAAHAAEPRSASIGEAITSVADLPSQMVVLDKRVEELSKRVDELAKSVAAVNQTLAPVGALARPEGLKPVVEGALDAAFWKAVALIVLATACGAGLVVLHAVLQRRLR